MPFITLGALLLAAAPVYPDRRNLLLVVDEAGQMTPVTTVAVWQRRRAHILASLQTVMGPWPDRALGGPLDVRVDEEVVLEHCLRRRLTFLSEPGDRVPAYLFLPRPAAGRRPAVLCLHQTIGLGKGEPAGLGGSENLHYARELADRGYVTLAPDYARFGDHQVDAYTLGYASNTMKGIWDHRRALDLLCALDEVDATRLGSLGHSLGGHNTLFLAAFDERVKVAVSSCGFNSFAKYYGGDLTGWSHAGYMPRIASNYGCRADRMPFDFPEILAAIAPRHVLVNAPLHDANFEVSGVDDCLAAATPVFALHGVADHLVCWHPDCGHDFPPAIRARIYAQLDAILGLSPAR